ncbi:thioredoxin-dependent thiol peroxidase [Patescibacteria group bacterium]|nr:MAG: thioredoxin-dependent thiol peroxidase [Patescibacteria group bacterium]
MRPAPDFTLPDQNGADHSLHDYRGKWVVVYFYPKDDTPGCTKQACSFRDGREELERHNVTVLGISADTVAKHKKFAENHNLKFTLLSDPDKKVIQAFGAWGPKKFMGREFLGIHRNTYIVDPEGIIVKEYHDVKPQDQAIKILKDIQEIQHV